MSRTHPLPVVRGAVVAAVALVLSACGGDDARRRPLGESCNTSNECASGLCLVGQCLDPERDDDLDGLINRTEGELGSNPFAADTDGDGLGDREELAGFVATDSDGDGVPDIAESATGDADGDCINDQYDVHDDAPDPDLTPMLAIACRDLIVCGADRAQMQVDCSGGTARCVYPGYDGDPLTVCAKPDMCLRHPCGANTECTNLAAGATPVPDDERGRECACRVGYEGDPEAGCTDADACAAAPCGPNALCIDLLAPALADAAGRTCACADGFEGDPEAGCSAIEIDACLAHPCGANAACTDLPAPAPDGAAGRSCACVEGFEGDAEAGCTPIVVGPVEVDACLAHPCGVNAACTDLPLPAPDSAAGRTCACDDGFEGDPEAGCTVIVVVPVEVDACVAHPCGANASCTDLPVPAPDSAAGRTCACAAGYEGDAAVGCTLIEIDACLAHPCGANATCTDLAAPAPDSAAGRTCACLAGYEGDAAAGCTLIDVDACRSHPCGGNTVCTDHPAPAPDDDSGRTCACRPGLIGDPEVGCGPAPVEVDACDHFPCGANASCSDKALPASDSPSGRTCACKTGFGGDAETGCTDLDACAANPCGGNAVCVDKPAPAGIGPTGRVCACATGFGGNPAVGCEDLDGCAASPCGAHAICTDQPAPAAGDARTCACASGYGGDPEAGCVDLDACIANPCGSNATCTDRPAPAGGDASGRTCACKRGFEGDAASGCTDVDECDDGTDTCGPTEVCRNTRGGFACDCAPGTLAVDGGDCLAFAALESGGLHTCAIAGDHSLYCWGRNGDGALGDGTTVDRVTPTRIGSASDWDLVTAGYHTTCGLRAGKLYCWGAGIAPRPTRVGVEDDWARVDTTDGHTCGIRGGELYCWGTNDRGQLGDGTQTNRTDPTRIGADADWELVSTSALATCGVRAGELYCWGYRYGGGNQTSPLRLGTDTGWTALAAGAGGYHACGLRGGELYCWGDNIYGQLGLDTTGGASATPARIGTASDWTAVSAFQFHTCGVRAGELSCWGINSWGQLGTGDTTAYDAPNRVGTLASWTAVAAGDHHTCGMHDGVIACWGEDDNGQLGTEAGTTPVAVDFAPTRACAAGFIADDGACAAIDACVENPCGANTTCTDAPAPAGGDVEDRACACAGGYGGDPEAGCSDVDECDAGTDLCDPTATCDNSIGGYRCLCSDASEVAPGVACEPCPSGPVTHVGDLYVQWSAPLPTNLGCIEEITGGLYVIGSLLEDLAMPLLTTVQGPVELSSPNLVSADLPLLADIGGQLWVSGGALTTLSLPAVTGHDTLDLTISGTALASFDLASLARVDAFTVTGNASLPTCDAQALREQLDAVGAVTISGNLGALADCFDCGVGETFDGSGCVDVDECFEELDDCAPTALCDNFHGGFQCLCAEGTIDLNGDASECLPVAAVDSGHEHSCALDNDERLWCWGKNDTGQLGDGTQIDRPSPTRIGTETWSTISAGWNHTCGITTAGYLYCWGNNTDAQIGLPNSDPAWPFRSPSQVDPNPGWVAVSAGSQLTCALHNSGPFTTLWCWGTTLTDAANNTMTKSYAPFQVGSATNWTAVSAGGSFACGLRGAGELWCWGTNGIGQLGTETPAAPTGTVLPARVGVDTWKTVAAGGSHTCGITTADGLYCWGDSSAGQAGLGGASSASAPTAIAMLQSWAAVDADMQDSCAITTGGELWCWGANNYGQVGDGTRTQRRVPTRIGTLTDWEDVGVGAEHACGIHDGAVSCWGSNLVGQLGEGAPSTRVEPAIVAGPTWSALAAGKRHTCGLEDGVLECWGDNSGGQLGDGTTTVRWVPTAILDPGTNTAWSTLAAGGAHTCAVTSAGALWCWGSTFYGQIGDGTIASVTPKPATHVGVGGALDVGWSTTSAGSFHTCGVNAGALWCWGRGSNGRLGDGTGFNRAAPTQVGSATDWSTVSAGDMHTCAIRDGDLYCWGANGAGQLGTGDKNQSLDPLLVDGALSWDAVAAGWSQTCAIADGDLYCWGSNGSGQLGLDPISVNEALTPTAIEAGSGWVAVSAHFTHTCAVRDDGALFCWGDDATGKLGIGPVSNTRHTPTQVGSALDWGAIAAGEAHSCGLRGGALYCWGESHNYGQLGLGDSLSPGPVVFP